MHVRRYSTREVAKVLNLCVTTVRRLCARGDLHGTPAGRHGHYWHIYEPDLINWMRGNDAKTVLARSARWTTRRHNAAGQPTSAKQGTEPSERKR